MKFETTKFETMKFGIAKFEATKFGIAHFEIIASKLIYNIQYIIFENSKFELNGFTFEQLVRKEFPLHVISYFVILSFVITFRMKRF